MDASHGYDGVAGQYSRARSPSIGVATVRRWMEELPRGIRLLDLACGTGIPLTRVLGEGNYRVVGADASPQMLAQFRSNIPTAPAVCGAAQRLAFQDASFDGALAWGLLFLLAPDDQRRAIMELARVLTGGGALLMTAPAERGEWKDVLTDRTSVSLGADAYRDMGNAAGFDLIGESIDEGDNHYYAFRRRMRG
ncbi:MAG TPA: class I SAM-dependent methyltransferase [Gemmatimonadaceae bacterium]|nr:class I SAM-dependent methyltransferase [Gemmatimonadaceae bacterium]